MSIFNAKKEKYKMCQKLLSKMFKDVKTIKTDNVENIYLKCKKSTLSKLERCCRRA